MRYRKALNGESRFEWRRGDKVQLYGLARLFAARGLGWVLVVEGESDAWTAWHYGIPCIGVPGKAQWKGERGRAWARQLGGVQTYIWQEPDAEIFSESISRDIPDAQIIVAPDVFKDISVAHLAGVDVAQLIEDLRTAAVRRAGFAATLSTGDSGSSRARPARCSRPPTRWS